MKIIFFLQVASLILFSIGCGSGTDSVKRKTTEVSRAIEKMRKMPDSLLTKISIPDIDKEYNIKKGDIILDSFIIKNRGGMPLKIESIKSQCDCTAINFDSSKIIPVNHSMVVQYSIKTEAMNNGYNHRTINVAGNFYPFFKNVPIVIYIAK